MYDVHCEILGRYLSREWVGGGLFLCGGQPLAVAGSERKKHLEKIPKKLLVQICFLILLYVERLTFEKEEEDRS